MAEKTCEHCREYTIPEGVTREEFETMKAQVSEIHEFISGLASALNSPMVKSMLPPNMRGMLGG